MNVSTSLTIFKYLTVSILQTLLKMYRGSLKKINGKDGCILTWKAVEHKLDERKSKAFMHKLFQDLGDDNFYVDLPKLQMVNVLVTALIKSVNVIQSYLNTSDDASHQWPSFQMSTKAPVFNSRTEICCANCLLSFC